MQYKGKYIIIFDGWFYLDQDPSLKFEVKSSSGKTMYTSNQPNNQLFESPIWLRPYGVNKKNISTLIYLNDDYIPGAYTIDISVNQFYWRKEFKVHDQSPNESLHRTIN